MIVEEILGTDIKTFVVTYRLPLGQTWLYMVIHGS